MAAEIRLRGAPVDRLTQRWVMATGRCLPIAEHPWLDGPVGAPTGISDAWIDEHAKGTGATTTETEDQGLLPSMAVLTGPGFDPADLHPTVVAFYETTAAWSADVWSRWSRWAEPGGRLLNAVFAKRLRQLSLPTDPLAVAHGMDSRLVGFTAADGRHLGTAWQRTIRATGETIFGGFYGTVTRPDADRPSVRVVFPLPNGSLTVLLRPDVGEGGRLVLTSGTKGFGEDGAYLVVRPDAGPTAWVRRIPLPERFEVHVDPDGVLRCDHRLWLGRAPVLHLHYRLTPRP